MRTRLVVSSVALLCVGLFAAAAYALTAGDRDPTFAGDGTFTEPIGEGPRPDGRFDAIALQPDATIVAAGPPCSDANLVVRIRPDVHDRPDVRR